MIINVKTTNSRNCSDILLNNGDFWRASVVYVDEITHSVQKITFTDRSQEETILKAANWIINNIDDNAQIDLLTSNTI